MMNTCTVRIDLDHDAPGTDAAAPVYTPEDKLVGTAIITVLEPQRDVRVVLTRTWISQAHHTQSSGGEDVILLFEGDWLEPNTHRFPFIFHIPPGPYSYHGHLLDVDWVLEARVENASEALLCEQRKFILEASGNEREFIRGDLMPEALRAADLKKHSRRALQWVATMLLLLVGIALLYPNVAAISGAHWSTLLGGLAAIILAAYLARRTLRRGDSAPSTGWSILPVRSDYEAEPGDSVSFVVELKPNFKTSTRRVTASLRGVEQIWKNRKMPAEASDAPHASASPEAANDAPQVERHHFFEEPVKIEPMDAQDPEKHSKNTYRVRFRVPSDAPYSFYCPSASVTWAIEVHVDVGSWPDWRRDFPIIVRPNIDGKKGASPTALRS